MKNSINFQLTAGFGFCMLLLVAVVGFNFSAFQKLEKLYLEAVQSTGEMEAATDARHIGENLYQIIGNAVINRDMAKTAQLWADGKKTSMAKLQKVAEIADTPDEHAMVREALAALNDIFRIYEEEMLPLIMSGEAVPGPLAEIDARLDRRIEAIQLVLQQFARSISDENRQASAECHRLITNTFRSGLAISLLGVLAALAVSALTTRRIVRPLSEITRATLEMKGGNYLVELKYHSADELGVLADTFREMSGEVEKRTTELRESNEHLQREIGVRQQAEEEIRRLNAGLEQRVVKRTAELVIANEHLRQMIAAQKEAEAEILGSREELRNLSRHLQAVREEERTTISRDIHDELGQSLTALKLDVSWLGGKLPEGHRQLSQKTKEILKQIDTTIATVQRISSELRPGILDDLGLQAAIEWQAQEFQKRTGIVCEVEGSADGCALERNRATALFRIFQETLTNISRHAKATQTRVTLAVQDEVLVTTVTDNGKGISDKDVSNPKSIGLIGMRERVRYFGGELEIRRQPEGGTVVRVSIPLEGKGEMG